MNLQMALSMYISLITIPPGKLRIIKDKPGQKKVERISTDYIEGEDESCADILFTPKRCPGTVCDLQSDCR